MYNYKRYNKRRPRRSKPGLLKRGLYGAASRPMQTVALAKLAYAGFKKLRSMVNVEYKWIMLELPSQTATTTPSFHFLTGINQDTSQNGRNGNKVKLTGLNIKLNVYLHSTAVSTIVRCLLVQDIATDGVAPTFSEIFTYMGANPTTLSPYNPVFCSSKYRILMDKRITLDVNGKSVVSYTQYFKLATHLTYSGLTDALGDASSNHYHLIFISDQAAASAPTIDINVRGSYVDN